MCDFLQLCKYYVRIICTKGKKDHVWKHVMIWKWSYGNVFLTQIIMKVDHRFKILKSHTLWFLWSVFCHVFPMFGHGHIFFFFIVVCIHWTCHTTSVVHLIMHAFSEKKWLKKFWLKKKGEILFSLTFFLCIFLFG
jgi:hypothetical protein